MASRRKNKKCPQTLAKDLQASDVNGKRRAVALRLSEEYCEKIREVSKVCVPNCKVQPVIRFLIDLGYEDYKRKMKKSGKDSLTKSIRDAYWKRISISVKERNSKQVVIPINIFKHLEDKL
tara:strand:+ start:3402 stop:3764 length:363 start_codon:yes stop_codon:yes gene_type:complete